MTPRFLLATLVCILTVSCSSDAENKFEKVAVRMDRYFSEKPILLTSKKILKEGNELYAYYALRIIEHNISYNINRLASSDTKYNASLRISCDAVDNIRSGDLISDTLELQNTLENNAVEASGFSTTGLALANTDFSLDKKSLAIFIRYTYENDNWICSDITGGGRSESLVVDLQSFPQNKRFREVIGIASQ